MKYVCFAFVLTGCLASRSDELASELTIECGEGFVCDRGYCVGAEDVEEPVVPMPPRVEDPEPPPAGIDCATWTAAHFDPCALPGGNPLVLAGDTYIYNTDDAVLTDSAGNGVILANTTVESGLVLVVDSLTIASDATLRVIGKDPLIVASWSTIQIDGSLDTSSNNAGLGAGASPTTCTTHAPTRGGDDNNGAGGGGGGGFGGDGGAGGDGDADPNNTGDTGFGGAAGTAVDLPLLAGGCPGARGGKGDQLGGVGGAGGGAIQLSARLQISIAGSVNAGGAGGAGALDTGADADGGGGGGGSGGMIGLEAPELTIAETGVIAANGGGGGQGANEMAGARGQDGLIDDLAASGGFAAGADKGDPGGLGSAGLVLDGAVSAQNGGEGAGGGGGGAGFIAVACAVRTIDGTVSPPGIVLP